jgi:seryl-tRNA synthetase
MIDLSLLREKPDKVIELLQKKDPGFNIKLLHQLDVDLRKINLEVEELRRQKNELSAQAKKGITDELRDRSIQIGKELKIKETSLNEVKDAFEKLYLECPNLPMEDLPVGDKDKNLVVYEFGKKPDFNFEVKNHVELGEQLDWLDFGAAAKMTGSQFALYKKDAAKLVYSLAMLMIKNNIKHGYELILPPFLVNEQSLLVASNFPKFRDQVYSVDDGLFLTPTSEVNLTNLYRDHIFSANDLPIRLTSWTNCFRREAGSYGAQERGLIRIHQFDKVELYTICQPKFAEQEQEKMLNCAQEILKELGLHYRISLLATQDCSFPSAKTYDIEVWMPGQKAYYEVSSISNCTDFQARRGNIRFKLQENSKTEFVYTLNASSLAFPRLIVALMETYQREDGSIELPDVLKSFGI